MIYFTLFLVYWALVAFIGVYHMREWPFTNPFWVKVEYVICLPLLGPIVLITALLDRLDKTDSSDRHREEACMILMLLFAFTATGMIEYQNAKIDQRTTQTDGKTARNEYS